MKKLAFLMSVLLLFTIVAPAQAAVESWVKYTYNHYNGISDPVYTGTGDVLVEDLEIDYDSVTYQQVYNYDVVKLNQQGVKNKKQLENGLNKLVHYDGKAYVLFFNYAKKQLEVYDEDFVLIDTEPFDLYSGGIISIYQSDEYIRYAANAWNTDTHGLTTSLIYDLKQLKLVENVTLPTVTHEMLRDYANETHSIYFYNALNIVNKKLSMASILDDESFAANTIFEFEDTLTFLSTNYSDDESTTTLYTISKEGTVLQQIELPKTLDYWDAMQKNDKLYLRSTIYDSNDDKPSFQYAVYDLNMYELKLNQPENPIFDQTKLNGSYVAQSVHTNDHSSVVVKNAANEQMYTLHDVYEQPDVLSDYYFAVIKYDSQIGRMTQIIETATGKVLKEYTSASIYKLSDESFYAVESLWDEVNHEGKFTGEVVQFQPFTVPAPPVTPVTYNQDKKWTVTFTADVDDASVNLDSMYVLDAQGGKVNTTHKVDGEVVYIFAPAEGYVSGKTYTLYVEPSVQSAQGQALQSGQTKQFTIK